MSFLRALKPVGISSNSDVKTTYVRLSLKIYASYELIWILKKGFFKQDIV
jgi:hypothetical protein